MESSVVSILVGVLLGVLASSPILPSWVIAERAEPFIWARRDTFNTKEHYVLTGIQLMIGVNSVTGDIALLAF